MTLSWDAVASVASVCVPAVSEGSTSLVIVLLGDQIVVSKRRTL